MYTYDVTNKTLSDFSRKILNYYKTITKTLNHSQPSMSVCLSTHSIPSHGHSLKPIFMDFDIRQYHADQKHQHFSRVLKLSVCQNGMKQFKDDQFEFFKLISNSCSIKEKEKLKYNI